MRDVVEQLSVFLENKPGHLARMTRVLADADINLRALMVADTEQFGVVRIICDRPHAARAALEQAGFGASITRVIAVEIPDRPGGLAEVLETLSGAGINVEYAYAFVEPGASEAVDIFKVDSAGAAEALMAAGLNVIDSSRLYESDGEG